MDRWIRTGAGRYVLHGSQYYAQYVPGGVRLYDTPGTFLHEDLSLAALLRWLGPRAEVQ